MLRNRSFPPSCASKRDWNFVPIEGSFRLVSVWFRYLNLINLFFHCLLSLFLWWNGFFVDLVDLISELLFLLFYFLCQDSLLQSLLFFVIQSFLLWSLIMMSSLVKANQIEELLGILGLLFFDQALSFLRNLGRCGVGNSVRIHSVRFSRGLRLRYHILFLALLPLLSDLFFTLNEREFPLVEAVNLHSLEGLIGLSLSLI